MSAQPKLPLRVVAAVTIKRIRLIDASVRARISSMAKAGSLEIDYAWSASATSRDKDGTFRVVPYMEARVSRKEAKTSVVTVKAAFEITYGLPKGFAVTRRELEDFAETNGVFNAWPYWREFIQNMFARMDLPQPALPLYRVSQPDKGKAKDDSKGKSSVPASAPARAEKVTRSGAAIGAGGRGVKAER